MRPVKEGVVPAPASTPGPEHDNALRPPTRRLLGFMKRPCPTGCRRNQEFARSRRPLGSCALGTVPR